MSELESQQIECLSHPYIPYGKITIIQGDPGEGKTTLVLNLAANLSRGHLFEEESISDPKIIIF